MISVTFFESDGEIRGFEVKNHGDSIVCAAVSALTINAANSLEEFTGDDLSLDMEDEEYIRLIVGGETGEISPESALLLKSFKLGVCSVKSQYESQIDICVKAWEV